MSFFVHKWKRPRTYADDRVALIAQLERLGSKFNDLLTTVQEELKEKDDEIEKINELSEDRLVKMKEYRDGLNKILDENERLKSLPLIPTKEVVRKEKLEVQLRKLVVDISKEEVRKKVMQCNNKETSEDTVKNLMDYDPKAWLEEQTKDSLLGQILHDVCGLDDNSLEEPVKMQKTHQCSMALASIYGSMVKTFTWPAARLASLVMRSLTSSKQLLDYMGAVIYARLYKSIRVNETT